MWPPWLLAAVASAVHLRHRGRARHFPGVDRILSETKDWSKMGSLGAKVEKSRLEMEHKQHDAQTHMTDGFVYKQKTHRLEQFIKGQKEEVSRLEKEKERLVESHNDVAARLAGIMEPKVERAVQKSEKEKKLLEEAIGERTTWEKKTEERHEEAKNGLDDKRKILQEYVDANDAVAAAKKRRSVAEEEYRLAKTRVGGLIASYQYAATQLAGASTREEDLERRAKQAEEGKTTVEEIKQAESRKATEAVDDEISRIDERETRLKAKESRATQLADNMRERYVQWQVDQQNRTASLAKSTQEYEDEIKAFTALRAQMLEDAAEKAGKREEDNATTKGGDWAWGSRREMDVELTPSEAGNAEDTSSTEEAASENEDSTSQNKETAAEEEVTGENEEVDADKKAVEGQAEQTKVETIAATVNKESAEQHTSVDRVAAGKTDNIEEQKSKRSRSADKMDGSSSVVDKVDVMHREQSATNSDNKNGKKHKSGEGVDGREDTSGIATAQTAEQGEDASKPTAEAKEGEKTDVHATDATAAKFFRPVEPRPGNSDIHDNEDMWEAPSVSLNFGKTERDVGTQRVVGNTQRDLGNTQR